MRLASSAALRRRCWLWLPLISTTVVRALEVADDARVVPAVVPDPTWLALGDSITQGFSAEHPTDSWPARLMRHWQSPGWNLGVGGIRIVPAAFTWALSQHPWQRIIIGLGSNHTWVPRHVDQVPGRARELLDAVCATDCPHLYWLMPPWKPMEVGAGPAEYMGIPLDAAAAERQQRIRDLLGDALAPYAPRLTVIDDLMPTERALIPMACIQRAAFWTFSNASGRRCCGN